MDAFHNKVNGLKTAIERLAQVRDDQRLKLLRLRHADGQSQWQELEDKWAQLRHDAQQIEEAGAEVDTNVWAGVESLVAELTGHYEKLRREP